MVRDFSEAHRSRTRYHSQWFSSDRYVWSSSHDRSRPPVRRTYVHRFKDRDDGSGRDRYSHSNRRSCGRLAARIRKLRRSWYCSAQSAGYTCLEYGSESGFRTYCMHQETLRRSWYCSAESAGYSCLEYGSESVFGTYCKILR